MFCFSQIKSLPSDEPDQTIEILMSELDPKVREVVQLLYCFIVDARVVVIAELLYCN
jgi:hypothetical protein